MSSLVVEVCKITKVFDHPNADRMDLAQIKGWQCCVKKDQYKTGDVVVFIPPDSDIPKDLSERLGIVEYLGGKKKNRVKTVKLRGEISEGIIIPNENSWPEGTDVAKFYGITKYIPPLRASAGDAGPEDVNFMRLTDIENIKNYPDTFAKGQMVSITEKIDGCFREDQKVSMANGEQIPISEVKIGDMVLSYDEDKKEFIPSEVKDVMTQDADKEWLTLYFDNKREIVCTSDHLFLTKNRGWIEADNLTAEDELVEF